MDWISEIKKLPDIHFDSEAEHISLREASGATQKYEKAIFNAANNSIDIAIIELRKLCVLYPESGQLNLALGCCQMAAGRINDAKENFKKSIQKDISSQLIEKANNYIEYIENDENKPQEAGTEPKVSIPPSASGIIEITQKNYKNRKMAGRKERREISQNLGDATVSNDFFVGKTEINWVKLIASIIIVASVILIITMAFIHIPPYIKSVRESDNRNSQKLEWLLDRLEKDKEDNQNIANILDDYDKKFYPETDTPVNSFLSPGAISLTISQPESSPSPTLAPTPTVDEIMTDAHSLIIEAQKLDKKDPARVMEIVTQVKALLAGMEDQQMSPSLELSVGDLLAMAYDLETKVVDAVCVTYYNLGQSYMKSGDYMEAVESFKKVYEINPGFRSGGNIYNLAKAYAEAGDQRSANYYFEYVIEHYPGSDHAGWAKYRIKPLESEYNQP